jgi:hypothetical protein
MAKRRSLTPGTGSQTGEVHATRRGSGGARKEVTDRVCLRKGAAELSGWALNASRGGIRLIVEDKVELGWVQEEADGMIVGIEYIDQKLDGSDTPATGSEPPGVPISARVPKGD